MRFSSPSQLVRDAQRHGVKVLPVDVAISVWDSSLEQSAGIVADYRSVGLTLGRHPLELLRPELLANRLMPASTLRTYRDERLARGCGLVTARQRPGTAKGGMFVTLEDETGNVNVIV